MLSIASTMELGLPKAFHIEEFLFQSQQLTPRCYICIARTTEHQSKNDSLESLRPRWELDSKFNNFKNLLSVVGALTVYPCLFYPSDNVWRSWRASVRALYYSFHTFLDQTTNISRNVRAPRRVSASWAPNNVPNCHLDKTNMDNSSMHLPGILGIYSACPIYMVFYIIFILRGYF